MFCPKCGKKIDSKISFCTTCGADLRRKCVRCGANLALQAKFCPKCGSAQDGNQSQTEQAQIQQPQPQPAYQPNSNQNPLKEKKGCLGKIITAILVIIGIIIALVFVANGFDDLEADKRQILSLFKKYELSSSTDNFTFTIDYYDVWDYNDKKLELCFIHARFSGDNFVSLGLGAYGGNISPVTASCPISQKRLPVTEFINGFNGRSYIGKKANSNSQQYAQTQQQSTQTQGYNVMPELKSQSTQSRSQSTSTIVSRPSGTIYQLYDWHNNRTYPIPTPTVAIDCTNTIDGRKIKDSDTILITNLTITFSLGNTIAFEDRHGHPLYEDLYGRRDIYFRFTPREGHPDWWDDKLDECAKGKWDKYTQSYGKKTPVSVYAKVRRESDDDYLELIGFVLPN